MDALFFGNEKTTTFSRFITIGFYADTIPLLLNPIGVNADFSSAETKAGLKMPSLQNPSFPNFKQVTFITT